MGSHYLEAQYLQTQFCAAAVWRREGEARILLSGQDQLYHAPQTGQE